VERGGCLPLGAGLHRDDHERDKSGKQGHTNQARRTD
jgi:hypothetical protein